MSESVTDNNATDEKDNKDIIDNSEMVTDIIDVYRNFAKHIQPSDTAIKLFWAALASPLAIF